MIELFVPGIPAPKGSMRAFKTRNGKIGTTHDNARTKPWQAQVAFGMADVMARAEGPCPKPYSKEVPLQVVMVFIMPRPKRAKKRLAPWTKPDLDKLARTVLDAGTGIVWSDDSQVVALEASKMYEWDRQGPGLHLTVTVREQG